MGSTPLLNQRRGRPCMGSTPLLNQVGGELGNTSGVFGIGVAKPDLDAFTAAFA